MKKAIVTFFVAIMFVVASFSQPVLDSTYVYKFENVEWVNVQRVNYTYDDAGKQIDKVYYQVRDGVDPYIHYTTIYSGELVVGHTLYSWDSLAGDWVGNVYNTYEYGETQRLTKYESFTWDPETDSWVNDCRMLEAVDNNGDPVGGVYYYGDQAPDSWIEFRKYSSTYNGNNQLIEEQHYYWDSVSVEWVHDGLIKYNYDTQGNRTIFESSYRNPVTDEWKNNLLMTSLYDYESREVDASYFHADTTNNWVGYMRYTKAYDGADLVEEVRYTCQDDVWINAARYTYAYSDGDRIEELYYTWDPGLSDWTYDYKEEHYWTYPTIIGRGYTDNIMIYPNPLKSYTIVKLGDENQIFKIEILDISGRLIRIVDNINDNPVTLHLGDLASGPYLIRIEADKTYLKKIIIL